MITQIDTNVSEPWSTIKRGLKEVTWQKFGDEYDAVTLNRKDLSPELVEWLGTMNLTPISASMFTLFPGKIPPVLVDSPYCEVDDHARLYWVYDAPVHFTWYKINEELSMENAEKIIGLRNAGEEDNFKNPFTGWYPKPEVLIEQEPFIIQPNTCVLLNAGIPIKTIVEGNKRAKVFSVGFCESDRNHLYNNGNGMKYQDALKCFSVI
jgi:hypothetical protein